MQYLFPIFCIFAGSALLYYGADYLIKGGASIALKCGIPALIIGLTLVAAGTSAPELVVSIDAATNNNGNISLGNVIGSNICNIALIMGVSSLIKPLTVNKKLLYIDLSVLCAASIILAVFCIFNHGISRWQGAIFLTGFIVYTVYSIFSNKKNGMHEDILETSRIYPWYIALFFVIIGLAGLISGAKLFVLGAVNIAKASGISDAVIGLTIVALGTSLPELATSAVASFKGEQDIAVGNAIGSNIFNILCILGIVPLIQPINAPEIAVEDVAVMILLTISLFPVMRSRWKIHRTEGFGLLAIYIFYTAYLFIK